ncbi:MAG: hypothetical protein COV44_04045 [Deltaproteobacteria bacterium CG11_big_fil_rev_8_21_14_0_20_45_16]|nr:MAG: hypothetical protein COV44_04045 [Deltaproteobacteria bacterium CG11_big_fil_rev_8_21_14_0_20_45_16]
MEEIYDNPIRFGSYRLLAKVAQGGMAKVYVANSVKKEFQGQFLAIKKLHEPLNANQAFVNLLIHEAKVSVLLTHPSIAQVYDLGSYQSEFFIAMEYVHGKSLDRVLEKIEDKSAPRMPKELATYLVTEILRALAFAHELRDVKGRELNIIHRDISPGNILLEYKGQIKLTDFGIATAESRLQPGFTQSALGKLIYMSPEQAVNDPVVKASDIYSLGIVYFQLLSGQLPFQFETASELMKKVIEGKITDIRIIAPQVDQELSRIIAKAIDRSSRKRYRSAAEFFEAINTYFIKKENVDFNSKSIRTYYKKKMAEYLRKVFAAEIISELELIQRAFSEKSTEEDLKSTRPQEISVEQILGPALDMDDKTIFEPDHTDEATRHYPLTETERSKILSGLPAREALSLLEDEDRTSDFELKTIPEYDLNIEDSNFKPITAINKLDFSSLGRDDKETLKQNLPAMEILSNSDLDAFESSMFSGRKPNGADLDYEGETRPHDREIAMEAMKKIESPVESIQPLSQARPSTSEPKKQYLQKASAQASRRKIFHRVLGLLGAIIAVLVCAQAINQYLTEQKRLRLALLPTKQISLIVLGEADLRSQREFFKSFSDPKNSDGVSGVETLLETEYKKYTGKNDKLLNILVHEPLIVSRAMSLEDNVKQILKSPALLVQFFESLGVSRKPAADASIFIYLLSEDSKDPPTILSLHDSSQPNLGFLILRVTQAKTLSLSLAQLISKIYQATDKEDPLTGLATVPTGMADPSQTPLYPQKLAELMAGDIPTSLISEKPIDSLKDVSVGPTTAYELGWIDKEALEKLMHSLP